MQLFFSPTVPSRVEIRDASTDSTWSEKNGAQKILSESFIHRPVERPTVLGQE